jgi:hypothetical protein
LIAEVKDRDNQLAAEKNAEKEARDAFDKALKDKDTQIAAAQQQIADAQKQIADLQATQTKSLGEVQGGAAKSAAEMGQQIQALQGQLATYTTNVQNLTRERDNLLRVLRRFKANNAPKEDIIRVPDGVITSVNGTDVFINLGDGDQIYRGMTFEVYDANKGIPPLGEGTDTAVAYVPRAGANAGANATPAGIAALAAARRNADKYQFEMPKGKGSIEIIAVGPGHQSVGRIVKQEDGQTIGQGDLIGNLVYDKNLKFNFVVYGDFDLSGSTNVNGRANDAKVLEKRITEWGGNVQPIKDAAKPADSVTADTDFVVVGREPVVPNFTPEELQDPANQLILDRAKAKAAAYQSVLTKAAELGIPVMNQNRFLYFTGYFDSAKR